ncbi:MAG: hypothetical protein AB1489_10010 [Acidobacteriota bacterium]
MDFRENIYPHRIRLVKLFAVLVLTLLAIYSTAAVALAVKDAQDEKESAVAIVARPKERYFDFTSANKLATLLALDTKITLKVEHADMQTLGNELSQQVNQPITITPSDPDFAITIDIKDVGLDDILRFLIDMDCQVTISTVNYEDLVAARKTFNAVADEGFSIAIADTSVKDLLTSSAS